MNRSLKTYQGQDIRNVAFVGHAHCGKTTLISALLQAAKMTERLGRVDDGSAVTAYDEEDVARRTTMQNALAFAEWHNVKINFVDTPGFPMFVHEARAALLPVEAALVIVNAACGVEAVTRRVWKFSEEFNLPRVIVVNQMDHPRADSERTLNALREGFGRQVVPVQLPIVEGNGQNPVFRGVVDLITMEAFVYEGDGGSWVTVVDDLSTGLSGVMVTGEGWGVVTGVNPATGAFGPFTEQGSTAGLSYGGAYTAEWIVEDYELGGGLEPFADYGTVTFSDLTTNLSPPSLTPGEVWEIVQNGVVLSTPAPTVGNSFSVSYTG